MLLEFARCFSEIYKDIIQMVYNKTAHHPLKSQDCVGIF